MGKARVSPCELNKGTLISGGGQGSLRQAIMYAYSYRQHPFSEESINNKRKQRLKWKKQVQHGVRFCSSMLYCRCFYGGKNFQEVLALLFH